MGTSQSKTIIAAAFVLASCAESRSLFAVPTAPTFFGLRTVGKVSTAGLAIRGGDSDASPAATIADDEPSLDEKVYAAMKKLGMSPPGDDAVAEDDPSMDCSDGVCKPKMAEPAAPEVHIDPFELSKKLAEELGVDESLTLAAVGATKAMGETENKFVYSEEAAREMVNNELNFISQIQEDSPEVEQLVSEGFDTFMARRALAFADINVDDARAILIADREDLEEDKRAAEEDEEAAVRAQLRAEKAAAQPDVVNVKSNFDPTSVASAKPEPKPAAQTPPPSNAPKPAPKESVVFEATTAQIQELVLDSPVPVLLDIYADWCGPCKVLGPALEEMAVKAGGIFRLVKINSDNERAVSAALGVNALPTVFGVSNGKIVHMFEGMPRDEKMMQNFMMGLFGAAPFSPPVSSEQAVKYAMLTTKLIKTAGAASFSFSDRERLVDRIKGKLDVLVQDETVANVEESATLLRKLFSNIIKNPYEDKYRKINLQNKKIAAKLSGHSSALAILKLVGFSKQGETMTLANGKKVINVAPLSTACDCIDKWIQMNRREMAAAARRRKDELDRAVLQAEAEAEARGDDDDVEEESEEEEVIDPTVCTLKLRLDGKKKVHEVVLDQDQPLRSILESLNVDADDGDDVRITCVAKRLVIKSSDSDAMDKSLKEHGLMPAAALVVKVGESSSVDASAMKDRAAKRKLKKGSHTMQSIGVYAKDDNNKGELIDGGGGVMYEQDVSDDEEEEIKAPEDEPASADDNSDDVAEED